MSFDNLIVVTRSAKGGILIANKAIFQSRMKQARSIRSNQFVVTNRMVEQNSARWFITKQVNVDESSDKTIIESSLESVINGLKTLSTACDSNDDGEPTGQQGWR